MRVVNERHGLGFCRSWTANGRKERMAEGKDMTVDSNYVKLLLV